MILQRAFGADAFCGVAFNLILFIIYLLTPILGRSQLGPQPLPVSPEAAALAKMVNYQVNLNTGIPEISIDLYSIRSGGFTLPIGLSYHAGGFKVNERATSVGLGWSLDCELQITRTINGISDFGYGGYIGNSSIRAFNCPSCDYPLNTVNSYSSDYGLATGSIDGAPDKFNYKLLDKSGAFYFQKNASGGGYTIVSVPYDNIRISFNNNLFTIVDTDGTTYYFGGNQGNGVSDVERGLELTGDQHSPTGTSITAWKCKRIVGQVKTQEIIFEYQAKTTEGFESNTDNIELYINSYPCGLPGYWTVKDITSYNPTISTYEHLMQQIPFYTLSSPKYMVSTGGRRELHMPDFNSQGTQSKKIYPVMSTGSSYGTTVKGLALHYITFPGGTIEFDGADELKRITVRNSESQEVRSFTFFQSYANAAFNPGIKTRYLDSVQMKTGNDVFERYFLHYTNKFCFGDHLVGQDAWGYTNSKTEEPSGISDYNSVPSQIFTQPFYLSIQQACSQYIPNATFAIGNSDPSAEVPDQSKVALNGMLRRIVYPTGGRVEFDFESNQYEELVGSEEVPGAHRVLYVGGGLRIKSINYYDAVNVSQYPVMQKSYTYGELENGAGMLINKPAKKFRDIRSDYEGFHYDQVVAYVTGPSAIPGAPNTPFYPISLDCYTKNCLNIRYSDNKRTFLPASAMNYTYSNGAPIYYTRVTEYQMDQGRSTGKKVYAYYPPYEFVRNQDYYASNVIADTNIPYLQGDGLVGHLESVQEYKFKNERFVPVHTKRFSYYKYATALQPRVVYSFLRTIYEFIGGNFQGQVMSMYDKSASFASGSWYINQPDFISGQYGIEVAKILMATEIDTWILDDEKEFTTNTTYHYDKLPYLNPTSIEVWNSKGENTVTYFKYPYDFPDDLVYGPMATAGITSPVVETSTTLLM